MILHDEQLSVMVEDDKPRLRHAQHFKKRVLDPLFYKMECNDNKATKSQLLGIGYGSIVVIVL